MNNDITGLYVIGYFRLFFTDVDFLNICNMYPITSNWVSGYFEYHSGFVVKFNTAKYLSNLSS
jgi:hypothetical protein